jgi:uncharacterized repeat protein (TIGR01451 family)
LSPWVSASPPQITVQPQKWTVTEGGSYTFTVTAGGTAPLSFQWRKDNVDLADKTNSTLPLTLIQTNAAGLYAVVITNLEGAVTSAPARLTVRLAGDPAYAPPQGGWAYLFGGDSAAGSLSAALDGTWDHSTDNWAGDGRGAANPPAGGIGTTNGILTIEDTVTSGSGFNNRRLHLTHNLAQETGVTNAGTLINDGVTLTFRARLTPATDPLLELTNAPNGLVNNSDGKGMFGIHQGGASGISIGFSLHQAVEDLSTTTSFTFAQAGLHLNNLNGDVRSSFVDPGEGGTTNILALDPAAFHEFWITVQDNGADPGTHRVSIYLDGSKTPTVFNVTAGVGTEGPAANYLALGMGSTAQRGAVDVDFFGYKPGVNLPSGFNEPVGIVSQPTNVFTATGQLASFSVGVTGTPPYGFQWYRDGSSLTDATNATYVTGPVVTSDNGAQFFVVITNDYGSVTSSVAGLSLLGPPSITAQPQSLTVTNGDSASFSVTANSQGTTTYQWRFGGNPVAGQTNTTFFLASAGPANAGNYDVVVSNPSGSVTSTLAVLTVVLFDFGDAPDPGFPTLKASNGARHRLVPGVFLGAAIDAEIDGQPEATAAGDDGSGADDEDGVTFGGPLRVGQTASVSVVASTNGFLNAWLDFNRNGSWTGAGEQVFTNVALVTGTNALSFPVPASASLGGAFARFRFSTAGGLSFDGPASDGEVEDYMVMLMAVANVGVSLTDSPDPVAATSNLTYTIVVTNAGPSAAADVDLSDALPAGATFVSALPSQGSCSLNAGVVSCDLGSLANNATVTVQLRLRPGASGPLTNSVSVANPDFDPVAGNNTASITTTVLDGPIITVQPQSLSVTNGNNATLSVTATGTLPLRYQWSFGGNPLAGATNATLVITNAQLAQSGDYAVRITNIVGVVDSQTATLTVLVPPSILTSPQSRTNLAGSVATLSVTAAGSEPLSYQWRFNVTNLLAGATNSSLLFNSVQSSNAGAYRVDVSNAAGVATSLVAMLTVIEMDFGDAPGPYPTLLTANGARHRLVPGIRLGAAVDFEPDGQSGSNANGDDLNGLDDEDGVVFNTPLRIGQSVSVSVVASTNGVLNAWMDFGRDGSWGDPGDQIFTNRNLTAGTNTLTFLVPGGAVPGTTYARFRFGTTSGLGFTGEAPDGEVEDYALTVEAVAELAIHRLSALDPVAVDSNEVYSITLTNAGPAAATGVGLSDVLPPGITFISADTTQGACSQSSGLVSCSIGLLNPGGSVTVTVTIKSGTAGSLTNSVSVGGNEADLTPANNLASIVSTIMQPPQITSPPQSQTVTNGGTAVFTVGVVGTAPRFQWRRDGVNLPGATNATLTVTNAQLSSEGSYSVQVTNEVGSATSSGASLTVLAQVAIVTQPQSQTVGVGGTATFRVTATGSPPLFYQWDYNDVALPGETASNLVLTAVQTNQAGSYRVRVFNPSGSTTSAVVTLTVLFPPTFTQHPQSQTNLAGSSPSFSALVVGSLPLGYQWFFNQTNRLAAQTNSTLTLTNVQSSQAGGYALVASNSAGQSTSQVAVLTVLEVDFGDAPESLGYPTTLTFNGARHRLVPGVRLGNAADFETNGLPNATATGDDASGVDDEDGVSFSGPLLLGQLAPVIVVASTNGFLDAWIDFNANGTWADPEDRVLGSYAVTAGTNVVPVPISRTAALGTTFARFRFSTAGGLFYDGFAPDGEVEDYAVTIAPGVDLVTSVRDSVDPIGVNSNLTLTVVVTNQGPSTATGVLVTNSLSGSLSILSFLSSQGSCSNASGKVVCALGTLANGGSASVTINARANGPGTLPTVAVASSTEGDIAPADNTAVETTSVIVPPVTFTSSTAINVADATATAPGLGSPYPSAIVVSGLTGSVYKVTATLNNVSHGFASDLDIVLVGPGGQNVILMSDCGGNTVLSGLNVTFDDSAALSLPSGGAIASTTYRPTNYDPNSDVFPSPGPSAPFGAALSVFRGTDPNGTWSLFVVDDLASDTGAVGGGWRLNIITADPIADLSLTARDAPDPVGLNSNLVYTVAVTNVGPAAATAVTVSNSMPAGMTFVSATSTLGSCALQGGQVICNIGNLAPSAGAVATITVVPTGVGQFTNSFTVWAPQVDFVASNNLAQVVTSVRPVTDLFLAQTVSTNVLLLGQQLTSTLNVTNLGPNPANNVRLTSPLPPGVGLVSAVASQGACSTVAGTVVCDLGNLAVGARTQVTLVLAPSQLGNLTNLASVGSDEVDPTPTNNTNSVVVTVTGPADLAVSLTDAPDPAPLNGALIYTITVTNAGPLFATSVQTTNRLPGNVNFVSATANQGSCSLAAGVVTCNLGTITNGTRAIITLTVTPTATGLLTNSVGVTTTSMDPVSSNNVATMITTVLIPPSIVTAPQSQTVTNGSPVSFSVVAAGTAPLAYQWQLNSVDLPGATNAGYSIGTASLAAGGGYRVKLTNLVGAVTSTVATLTVLVPPTISDLGDQITDEDVSTAAIPFTIGDADAPVSELVVSAISSNLGLVPTTNIVFGGTGSDLTVRVTPARDQSGTAAITVQVRDRDNLMASDSFNLTVRPVNDPPTLADVPDQSMPEDGLLTLTLTLGDVDNQISDLVATASASSPTLVPTNNLSVSGTGTNRTLTLRPATNSFGTATVTITVTDTNGASAVDTFLLTVVSVNDPPTLDQPGDLTIQEDAGLQTVNLTGIGSGPTNEAQSVVVSASSSDPAIIPTPSITYTPGQSTGTLTFAPATNANGVVTLTVTVNDGGASNNIVQRTFNVTVNPVNDLPTISDIADASTPEDVPLGPLSFSVGDVETPVTNLVVTASSSNVNLVPTNNIVLVGTGTNRTVTVRPATNQSGSATITLTVTDGAGGQASDSFVVSVTPVNDPPSLTDVADQTTSEDVPLVLSITVGDAETPAAALALTVSSSNTNLIGNTGLALSGGGSNRVLTLTPVTNASGSATITLNLSDGTNTVTDTFNLAVVSVNDPPTLGLIGNVSVSESSGPRVVNLTGISSGASNENQTLVVSVISSDPAVIPTPLVNYTSANPTGSLTFTPTPGATGVVTLTVTVDDGGSTNRTFSRAFQASVLATNRPPTIAGLADVTIAEDTPTALAFFVNDLETPASSLVLTATSTNTNVVAVSGVVFDPTGTNRTLTVNPVAEQSGQTLLTVTVSDLNGGSNRLSFLVTVVPVNDPPTLARIANLSLPPGVGQQTVGLSNITAGATNEFQPLSVTAVSGDPSLIPNPVISYASPASTGSLSFTPVPGHDAVVTITVTVNDGGATNNTFSRSFDVTISSSNMPPTLADIPDQVTLEDVALDIPIFVNDANTPLQNLLFSLDSSNTNLVAATNVTVLGTGTSRTLHLLPATNQSGVAVVTLTVFDQGGGFVSDDFVLTVLPVAEPPTVAAIPDQAVNEDSVLGPVTLLVGSPDMDASLLAVTAFSSDTNLIPASGVRLTGTGSNRVLTVTPASNQFGSATLTVTVTDTNGLGGDRSFQVVVVPVNDPPTLAPIGDVTINEDAGTQNIPLAGIGSGAPNELEVLTLSAVSSNPQLIPNPTLTYLHPETTGTLSFAAAPNANGTARITVTVDDGQATNHATTREFTVTVNWVNDPPVVSALVAVSTPEDTPLAVPFVVSDDTTPTNLLTLAVTSSDTNLFPAGSLVLSGTGTNRTLTLTPATNLSGNATLTLTVTDTNLASTVRTFVVTVLPVNDPPQISDIPNQSMNEDGVPLAVGFTVGDVETAPGSLVVGAVSSNPALIGNAGLVPGGSGSNRTLTLTPLPNQNGTATITVTVRDAGGLSSSDSFLLTVNAANDSPVFSAVPDQTTLEDTPVTVALAVSDLETPVASLTLSAFSSDTNLVPAGNFTFGAAGASRWVTILPATNRSGSATINLVVGDGAASVTNSFALTVVPVNDPPSFNSLSNLTLSEDAGLQTVNLTGISSGAADESQTLVFQVTSSNPALIPSPSVTYTSPNPTGTLTFTPVANASGVATLTLTLNDGGASNNLAARSFVVTVTPTNDPPTISDITNQVVNEDTPLTLAFTVNDLETAPFLLTVSATSTNGTLLPTNNIFFTGSGTNRFVTLLPATNQNGTTLVTLTVSDGAATASDNFLLTVNPVNDGPTLNPLTDMTFSGNPSSQVVPLSGISSGASNESETLGVTASSSNPSLIPTPSVSYTSPNPTGSISFNPVNNAVGTTVISVTVTGANNTSITRTFTAYFRSTANSVPTISGPGNQTINEDTAAGPLNFTISDSGTPTNLLTVTASSSNTNLLPNANIVLAGNTGTRSITLTPAPHQSGTAAVTLSVTDTSFGWATNIFVLTVNPVNDPPTLSSIPDQVTQEDTPTAVILFVVGDVETPASSLTLTAASTNTTLVPVANVVFGGSGTNRALVVTPAANQSGTSLITVTVNDGSGGSTNRSFLVTVTATNDPPTITAIAGQTIDEDTATGQLSFTIGDVETAPASLTLTLASSNPALIPNGSLVLGGSGANRTLTVTPLADQSGTATISVTVTDAAGASNIMAFLVTVRAVNDPPTLGALGNVTVNEGSGPQIVNLIGIGSGAANENQTLVVTATSSNPSVVPGPVVNYTSPGATGLLTLRPAAGTNGSATITVTVNDGGAQSNLTSRTFTFTVKGAPRISDLADQVVDEDTATPALAFVIGDAESSPSALTLSAASSDTNLIAVTNIVFGGGSGANRTVTVLPSTNQFGHATVTVTVTDPDGLSASDSFEVVVNPVNDAPTLNPPADLVLGEDAGLQTVPLTGITAGPTNEVQDLTVRAFSGNPALIPSVLVSYTSPGTNGTLAFAPVPNATGNAIISVVVNDGQSVNGSVTQQFLVTINVSNDPPVISAIGPQATDEDAPLLVGFTVGDLETPSGALIVTATSSDESIVPNAGLQAGGGDGNRALLITPASNQSGATTISVTVTDGGGAQSSTSFLLTVRPVNDPPTITAVAAITIDENSSTPLLAFTVGDVETPAAALGMTAVALNSTLVAPSGISLGGTGANRTVAITPVTNQAGSSLIVLTVTDTNGASASQQFRLTVRALQAPLIQVQPAGVAATNGATVHFNVTAAGTPPLSYEWRHEGAILAGQTSATLTLVDVQGADAGNYTVVVRNSAGSVTSRPALLRILLPMSIVSIQYGAASTSVSFPSVAGLNYTVEYRDALEAGAWVALPTVAGNGSTLTVTDPAPAGSARFYRVRVE